MSEQDGGPAFPIPDIYVPDEHRGCVSGSVGMSLRDWFAGQALVGIASTADTAAYHLYAEDAYAIADAMLKAREGGQ
jgi:hypothetical protein